MAALAGIVFASQIDHSQSNRLLRAGNESHRGLRIGELAC